MPAKTFEDLKGIFRPDGIEHGVMQADHDKCTQCGLCIKNCPFKCWEEDSDGFPAMKEGDNGCLSCFNCLIACPVGAIEIVKTWKVNGGCFDNGWPEYKLPLEAKDADGNPVEWNEIENTIFERRSVRNFKNKPVPDYLIRRVLEAGRFGPSAGNNQNWKFTVVANSDVLKQLNDSALAIWGSIHTQYHTDDQVPGLWEAFGGEAMPLGAMEPRGIIRGLNCLISKELPVFLNAPCVIFVGTSDNMFSPDLHVGIAGQNMNLVASSIGLGMCWSGFGAIASNLNPEVRKMLNIEEPWRIVAALCIGYPAFKQKGIVKRERRPITWYRQGNDEPDIES